MADPISQSRSRPIYCMKGRVTELSSSRDAGKDLKLSVGLLGNGNCVCPVLGPTDRDRHIKLPYRSMHTYTLYMYVFDIYR